MNFNEKLLKENYFNPALATIQEIVQIPSYAQSPTKTAPYGSGVAEVLNYVIKLAKSLGFKTYQAPNGKYGYVEYGDGTKTFAILGHLDVVPPGDLSRWKTPPFEPKIIEDILYGRGVLDDKGPTMIVLYCLKYLKDHNYQPLHKIRLIFGLTEETTWDSITTYMATEGTPDFGFTPDGLFPLTYAEKAIVNLDINGPGDERITLQGGDAYNVTCAFATTTGVDVQQLAQIAKQNHYQFEIKNNSLLINGKPAHGSRPADGINAGLQSLLALKALGHQHPLVQFVADKLQEDTAWKQYFGQYNDESGSFTINVGMVTINQTASKLACNIRIPVHTDYQIIVEKIRELIQPYGLSLTIEHYDKPLYMAQDSPLVKKLMAIYQNVTGDKTAQPIAIGGGTYARSMPNCVAFGAIFDDKTSTEHTYNECIKLKELWQAMLIYLQAIATLGMIEKI